ncbi:MAG: hypothetical protein LAT65_03415 [Saccharospirillum sp.]|nr:hypothetical protein [Saccharospirillum sp.]
MYSLFCKNSHWLKYGESHLSGTDGFNGIWITEKATNYNPVKTPGLFKRCDRT